MVIKKVTMLMVMMMCKTMMIKMMIIDDRFNLSIVDQYLESAHCSHQHATQQVTICHCDVVIRGRVDFKQSNCSRGQYLMRIVIRKVMRMIIMIRIVMGMMIVISKVVMIMMRMMRLYGYDIQSNYAN